MKRPLVTNQSLSDVPDMILAKSEWHSHNKQLKMKVSIMGDHEAVKFKAESFKFAFKSVNLCGYSSLIENLIQFREKSNPYVDSMLHVANSKSKFKVIKPCEPMLVEAVRQATCLRFRLNSDQEFVLNEVTTWFLPKPSKEEQLKEIAQEKPTKRQPEDEFGIIGMEDAISSDEE